MTPADHQRASALFERLRGLDDSEWGAAVDAACPGNVELRDQVLRILEADRAISDRSFLKARAIDDAARLLVAGRPKLPHPGTVIGTYRLGPRIGAGGMGVVYEAQDLRLHRRVAVKILPPPYAEEAAELVSRFQREARAASLLNHPNIVTIFDAGFDGDHYYIATEFVDGGTLKSLTAHGPLAWKALADIALQVSSALAAAHDAGIVHRDIKPENVMIRPDGIVKVLDFGLAKFNDAGEQDVALSRTGTILGTAAYMSPEQARGEEPDARGDVFSLGAVLYEMATGRQAFPGATAAVVHDAILNRDPVAPSNLNSALPPRIDEIVLKAVEKDRELRYQSAAELSADLKRLKRDTESGRAMASSGSGNAVSAAQPAAKQSGGRRWIWAVAAAAVTAAALALGWYAWPGRVRPPEFRERRLTPSFGPPVLEAAISPDGGSFAYADNTGLYLKIIDSSEVHPLPSPPAARIYALRWMPNNRDLLVTAMPGASSRPALWTVSVYGGEPRLIRDDVRDVAASPDGSEIVFTTASADALWVMEANGERVRKVVSAPPGRKLLEPAWYLKGHRVLCLSSTPQFERRALELVELQTGGSATISSSPEAGEFVVRNDGQVLSIGNVDTLSEIRIGPNPGSSPVTIRHVRQWPGVNLFRPSISADGKRLLVLKRVSESGVFVADLRDSGKRLENVRPLAHFGGENNPHDWTPDSQAVVFESNRDMFFNIFKQRLDRETPEGLVTGHLSAVAGRFSPDGKWLFYEMIEQPGQHHKLMRISVSGGPAQVVLAGPSIASYYCTRLPANFCVVGTSEAKQVVFRRLDPALAPPAGGFQLSQLPELAHTDYGPSDWGISPDGSRIAMVRMDEHEGRIHILPLGASSPPVSDVIVPGWANLFTLNWAADGKGWYVSNKTVGAGTFLYIDLRGRATVLNTPESYIPSWGVPSPDGRHLAFASSPGTTTAWLVENF